MNTLLIKLMLEGESLLLVIPEYDIAIENLHRYSSNKALLMQKREFLKGRFSVITEILNAKL